MLLESQPYASLAAAWIFCHSSLPSKTCAYSCVNCSRVTNFATASSTSFCEGQMSFR